MSLLVVNTYSKQPLFFSKINQIIGTQKPTIKRKG